MQYTNMAVKNNMNKLEEAKRVFDIEIEALTRTQNSLDFNFVQILDLITNCTGKVIVTGIGKPGHIAKKISATFASLGTPSFYLHPAEAMHGDLGMISSNDIVLVISYSGESDEILKILPGIKLIGATLIGITGNPDSTLAHTADLIQVLPKFQEACYLGLAPTSSTTVALCYGDALAIVASGVYGFKDTDFGKFHPAGSLGKKLLLTVDDLMMKDENIATVPNSATLKDAIVGLCKGLGIVSVVNPDGTLAGIITDGDLRRQLKKEANVYQVCVKDIMTHTPITIASQRLAVDALRILKEKKISHLPVLKNRKVIGTIGFRNIIGAGIVI